MIFLLSLSLSLLYLKKPLKPSRLATEYLEEAPDRFGPARHMKKSRSSPNLWSTWDDLRVFPKHSWTCRRSPMAAQRQRFPPRLNEIRIHSWAQIGETLTQVLSNIWMMIAIKVGAQLDRGAIQATCLYQSHISFINWSLLLRNIQSH